MIPCWSEGGRAAFGFNGRAGLLSGMSPLEGRKIYPALKSLTSLFCLSSDIDELLLWKACEGTSLLVMFPCIALGGAYV